jgi:hypothetical protein
VNTIATRRAAGLAGIAFPVLLIAAFFVSSPPGGEYSTGDIANFVEKGHRPAVFVSVYLGLLAVAALIGLLARLRDSIRESVKPGADRFFWGTAVAGAAALAIGWLLVLTVPVAIGYAGTALALDPQVVYTICEAGWIVMFGAGGVLIGIALVVAAFASRRALPGWLSVATGIAGVAGISSVAWFPFFVLLLWSLLIGVWLLLAGARTA